MPAVRLPDMATASLRRGGGCTCTEAMASRAGEAKVRLCHLYGGVWVASGHVVLTQRRLLGVSLSEDLRVIVRLAAGHGPARRNSYAPAEPAITPLTLPWRDSTTNRMRVFRKF